MAYDVAVMGSFGDEAESDEAIKRQQEEERMQGAVSGFLNELDAEAQQRVRSRSHIEKRWIDDLRQYRGLYDTLTTGVLQDDPDRSKVFINITRPKTTAWAARLGDMLFPNDDRNWGIQSTPVPSLVHAARMKVQEAEEAEAKAERAVEEHNQMVDQGAPPEALAAKKEEAEQAASLATAAREYDRQVRLLKAESDRRAELMQTEVEDQLVESRYASICRDVIEDSCKLGIGILKGPLTSSKPRRRWEKTEQPGVYQLTTDSDPRPMYRRVNPWHFFPDPDATEMPESESTYERHLLSKAGMRRWAKTLGWNAKTVQSILSDGPMPTTSGDFNWLTQLRTMEDKSENAFVNRYVVWEYHGPMEVEQIVDMLCCLGRSDDAASFLANADPLETQMVIVYFCQGQLLKIEEYFPLDSGETLYSAFPFEKSESSILGAVGVPWLMRHEQSMLNSAVRMMMDNAALSVGPQVVIDKTQVEPEDGSWKLKPRKVWKKKTSDTGRESPPFATYNIPMNQAQLAGIIELCLRFIDDVVSMPTIAQGEMGAHVTQTSSGMSMLFNSANVVFRRVVKNWDDDLTTPSIRRAFDWNMQFNPNDEIKGDMQVEARGTSVLLVREIQSQQLMMIAQNWTTHPIMGPAIKVYDIMRMTLQALNINPNSVLCAPEEFEKRLQQMAESQAGQESPDAIRAQAQIEVANITARSHREAAETQRAIAEMNRQTEILKLIQKDGVDFKRIEAMLQNTKLSHDSKERIFASEAALERRNAEEARAAGEQPSGSGGYISEG